MRYFAMIDDERRGPFDLEQLPLEGVTPDTYVWCKGMDDWQKAEDVADICRFFRRRLSDLQHPVAPAPVEAPPVEPQRHMTPYEMINAAEQPEPDYSAPPAPTLFLSIFLTLFCFPITGLVAVWYSYKARKAWQESQRSESEGSRKLYDDKEREELRKLAHDYDRQAKMWIGITFFLSIIFYAFVGHKMI